MKHSIIISAAFLGCLLAHPSTAQTAAIDNKISQSVTFHPIPKGPSVWGIFQGRPPCRGLTEQLKLLTPADCTKLKWNLILYRDTVTSNPATYTLSISGAGDTIKQGGGFYLQKSYEGKWTIIKGIPSNSHAEVYCLALARPAANLYLLKGDDNLLFVLDENKAFRVGNEDFSYTLNRVELVPAGNHIAR